jgi:two-component system sensor histidine kinase DegS
VHLARNESLLSDFERHEIYLICHEGLRNVFAHAQASRISVRVDIGSEHVQAVIEDDGLGFDAGAGQEPGHYGLTSMKARAEMLGGVFDLSSFPGRGTRASVRIPLRGLEWSL